MDLLRGGPIASTPTLPPLPQPAAEKQFVFARSEGEPRTVRIKRVRLSEFERLEPGAVLVDTRTHEALVVGVHFFDLRSFDGDGFLNYGFSDAIPEQPFAGHAVITGRHYNRKGDARRGNYGEFHEYDLPPAAKDYLSLNTYHSSTTGGESGLELWGGLDVRLHFTYPKNYGDAEGSHHVFRQTLYLGKRMHYDHGWFARLARIAKEQGLGEPTMENPVITLNTARQMQGFYAKLIEDDGGLSAIQRERNSQIIRELASYARPENRETYLRLAEFLKTFN